FGEASDGTGWVLLDDFDSGALGSSLSDHVKAPRVLARRLERIGLVGTRAEGDARQSALAAGERLVSTDGDLWRWDGYRMRAEDSSSGAAHRLRQRNQLVVQRSALEDASSLRAKAAGNHSAGREALEKATVHERACRDERRIADQAFAEAARQLTRLEGELELSRGRRESQAASVESRKEEHGAATAAFDEARSALDDLDDVDEARRAVELQRGEVDLARTAMLSARAASDDLRRQGLAREKRLNEISREKHGWQDRRDNATTRIADLDQRISEAEGALGEAGIRPEEIVEKKKNLSGRVETAEARRKVAADALAEGETRLRSAEHVQREAERDSSVRREERARCEALLDVSRTKVAEAAAAIEADLEMEPDALLETVGLDPEDLPPPERAETEVQRLRRQRDSLGAVNLRADEDAEEIRVERDTLAAEKDDLENAIAKLRRGIGELNREGRQRILEAFEQVNEKFAGLFRHLFGGGEARLVMVDSDDPLDAGLEILCQPPGKKLSTLSLLSGGEQTLTAMSLIFAVFLSNPAPICVLDEVDAPLDDANVTRFCDLLDEMVRRTQTRFLIITHHAITMSRMDRLFGVTMVERGVSQLVSVDLAQAAEMVDG
ncbi:MAG: chromosome segregation protein SMC, partial [Pseudomonadota bacterium]